MKSQTNDHNLQVKLIGLQAEEHASLLEERAKMSEILLKIDVTNTIYKHKSLTQVS